MDDDYVLLTKEVIDECLIEIEEEDTDYAKEETN